MSQLTWASFSDHCQVFLHSEDDFLDGVEATLGLVQGCDGAFNGAVSGGFGGVFCGRVFDVAGLSFA